MARGTPVASKGTIPSAGSGNIVVLRDQLSSLIEAITSNGTQAWTKTTIAADDLVYHSVGDRALVSGAGDTDIWVRLYRSSSTFSVNAAQDYSPTGGSPQSWASGSYRPSLSSTGNAWANGISDTAAIDWWFVGNEYEIAFACVQSGTYRWIWFGQPIRPFGSRTNGVARITSQSGTGDGVTLGLDRDITSNIQVGQRVLIVNQTPDGTAIQTSPDPSVITVVGKTVSSLTVDGIASTYSVGSLVGIDPCPVHFTYTSVNGYIYEIGQPDGQFASSGVGYQYGYAISSGYNTTEADQDPGYDGTYPVYEVGIIGGVTSPANGRVPRGKMQTVRMCPIGTQADGDLMQVDWNTSDKWWVFVNTNFHMQSSWGTMFGPGATA